MDRCAIFFAQINKRIAVACKDAKRELCIGVIAFYCFKFIEVVKRRPRDPHPLCKYQIRSCLAGVCKDDPCGINAQSQNAAELFDGGTVKAGAELGEESEEIWVGVALHGCRKSIIRFVSVYL